MINIGVIGTGVIGAEHIRRLTTAVPGARISSVTDVDLDRARAVADSLAPDASVPASGEELIGSPEVDAVVVTSWGSTHRDYVLGCISAGKPVFCEKPLASTSTDCITILKAEAASGRRWVQVGFMRRYDPAYLALRATVHGGSLGAPLLMHAAHRNPALPAHFTGDMVVTDSAVHEFDLIRWMFADEVAAITAYTPKRNSRAKPDFPDPLVLMLELAGGVLVDVEVLANARYGYDIRGEVVCEDGVAALSEPAGVLVRSAGTVALGVPTDWPERFATAFDIEFRSWLASVAGDTEPTGPDAWDGYAAAACIDAALASLHGGGRVPVTLVERPSLYR